MIIGIDASRANKSNKTGTEWYSWHLIEELKRILPLLSKEGLGEVMNDERKQVSSITPLNLPLEKGEIKFVLYSNSKLEGDLGRMPNADWQEKILDWPPKYLWTQIRLWWELLLSPPDVLLVPAHTIPLLPIRRQTRVLVNVHDVGFKRFPELYKPIQVWYHDLTMKRIKARADLIITISEFSKQEIIDLYKVPPEKIKVVYLGFDRQVYHEQAAEEIAAVKEKYGLADPYLLYVGRLEKKKNIGNIVKAFALARASQEDATGGLKLVLAGSSGNQYEEIKKIITDLKLEKEIILTGYVAQEDLPKLMAGARAFIFPTLYEGFGLPILEAMACGAPVIASNALPHTEVGGAAALYADPHSPEELSNAIIKVLESDDFRAKVVESGFLRAREFSWRQTAEAIYKIITTK